MQKVRLLLLALAVFGIVVPSANAADDELVEKLLKKIDELSARIEKLENKQNSQPSVSPAKKTWVSDDSELAELTSDPAPISGPTGASAEGIMRKPISNSYIRDFVDSVTVGGYASSEFENFQGKDSTFDQHRFVLNIGARPHERLQFYSELEFEHGAVVSSEGDASGTASVEDTDGDGMISAAEASDFDVDLDTQNGRGGEFEVEQAWMQFDLNDNLGVRTGVVLAPFGRFNLYHDDPLQNLTDRPLVARRVIPTTWSEAGIGLVANYEVGDDSTLGGEVYAVNGLTDGFSAGSGGLRGARPDNGSDNNNNKAAVGKVVFSPLIGQELGLSGYYGNYDDSGNAIAGGAFDWLFTHGNWRFIGEAAIFNFDEGLNSKGEVAPNHNAGIYAELNYSFWFENLNNTWLGSSFHDPKFVTSFRYNYSEVDRRGDSSKLDETGYVFGLGYRPVKNFIIKTEYQWNEGDLERKDSNGFIGSFAIGF